MKKLIILLLLNSFILACSSSPKSSRDETASATTEAAPADFETESAPDEPASVPVNPPLEAEAKASSKSPLDEAIKQQNDENIRRQAQYRLLKNPQDTKALNALALYSYKRGRFMASKYLLNKAIQAKPTPELYNNLGVVHLALNEEKEAILAFRQALKLDPQDGVAAANIGGILVKEKNYDKAVVALETAYRAGHRDVKVLNNYGIALMARGEGKKAEGLYEKALSEQSNSKELLFNYSVLLVEHLGKFKEGSEAINRLKFVGVPSEHRDRIKELENKAKSGLQ